MYSLARVIARLGSYQPDAVGDMVLLPGGVSILLRLMTDLLLVIAGLEADDDRDRLGLANCVRFS